MRRRLVSQEDEKLHERKAYENRYRIMDSFSADVRNHLSSSEVSVDPYDVFNIPHIPTQTPFIH